MPNLSKDNTMFDACLPHATQVSEHDGGNGNRDYMLLTCECAESSEAFDNRDFKIARCFFPKYKATGGNIRLGDRSEVGAGDQIECSLSGSLMVSLVPEAKLDLFLSRL